MAVCAAGPPPVIAVFKAVTGGNLEDLQRLLCGADVNKPRFLTLVEGHKKGLYAGRNPKKFPGGTCLHVAAWKGHEHVVKWLLQKGANINILDAYDRTPSAVASTTNIRSMLRSEAAGKLSVADIDEHANGHIHAVVMSFDQAAPRNMKRGKFTVHNFDELCSNYFESSTGLEKMLEVFRSNDNVRSIMAEYQVDIDYAVLCPSHSNVAKWMTENVRYFMDLNDVREVFETISELPHENNTLVFLMMMEMEGG